MNDRNPLVLAEQTLLGSLLRDNAAIDDAALLVRPDHFALARHQVLYRAMLAQRADRQPVDSIALANRLHASGELAAVGSYPYLQELWESTVHGHNASYYANLVRQHGLNRQVVAACQEVAALAPGHSGEQLLEMAQRHILDLSAGACGGTIPVADALADAYARYDQQIQGDAVAGLPTGWRDLDRLTGGLQPSELTVIAARPSVGKTALGLGLLYQMASQGQAVFFASLEMSRLEIAQRLICLHTGVDSGRLRTTRLTDEEYRRVTGAHADLAQLRLHIDDAPVQSLLRIAANARRLQRTEHIQVVLVDYLQLIEPEDRKASRQEQVASFSRRLKQLARELKIPVVALAQLNRNTEGRTDPTPRLSDLRESGAIEQDSDCVMLLHRKEENGRSTGLVGVDVAKQRNGPVGGAELYFRKDCMRFEDYTPAVPDMPPFAERCRQRAP